MCLLTYQRLSHEAHELMNQTLRKSLMVAFASKMELQNLELKGQRTCVSKSKAICEANTAHRLYRLHTIYAQPKLKNINWLHGPLLKYKRDYLINRLCI